jgi:hypothetical protein
MAIFHVQIVMAAMIKIPALKIYSRLRETGSPLKINSIAG